MGNEMLNCCDTELLLTNLNNIFFFLLSLHYEGLDIAWRKKIAASLCNACIFS